MARKKKDIEELEKEEELEEISELEKEEEPKKKVRKVINRDEEDDEELTMEERIANIEKKNNLILIFVVITLALVLISLVILINNGSSSSNTETTSETSEVASDYSYDTSAFKEISASEIKSESKNETIVIMIGRQGCGYCAYFAPVITEVAKEYGVTVRYIDYSKFVTISNGTGTVTDEDAYNTIYNLAGATDEWDGFAAKALGGTPATLFVKNNKVVYGISGYTDSDTLSQAFEEAGFSK